MIELDGLSFAFEEEDVLRELKRFNVASHPISRSNARLTPASVTWLTIFLGTCADINDAHLGMPPVADGLAMSEEDLAEAVAQRSHVADLIVGDGFDLSEHDRRCIMDWLSDLKRDAEAVGNMSLLNEVFWRGIDAAATRRVTSVLDEGVQPRAA